MVDTQQATDKSEKGIYLKKYILIINIDIFCMDIIKSISNQTPKNCYKKYN